MSKDSWYFLLNFILLCLLTSGCSTVVNAHRQKQEMVSSCLMGNPGAALEFAAKKVGKNDNNAVMWNLEAGALAFHSGNYDSSLEYFGQAESLMDDFDDRAVVSLRDMGAETGALFTNLNALPYQGLCRDRMMIPVFKSMAYLAGRKDDSFQAQVRRLRNHHDDVIAKYETVLEAEKQSLEDARAEHSEEMDTATSYTMEDVCGNADNAELAEAYREMEEAAVNGYANFLNPLAIFFSGIAALYDDLAMDNAAIEFKRLYDAMPANPLIQKYYCTVLKTLDRQVPRTLRGVKPFEFPLDRGCVFVIMGNGLSATLDQCAIYWPIMVAWPKYISCPRPFTAVEVSGGGWHSRSVPIADMDGIFATEMKRRMLPMLVRTILSTAVKETAHRLTIASIEASVDDEFARNLAVLTAEIAFTAYKATFNTADTRSWEILPSEFQLCQIPMPEDRRITLNMDGNTVDVALPDKCTSSIVYISAPSPASVTIHPLPLNRF